MVLRAAGLHRFCMADLRTLCPATSIWTIDLAHLLRTCGASVTFCTLTLGARLDCRAERYYADTTPEDVSRVDRLFQVII